MTTEIRVLVIGDAVGRPGREAVKAVVPRYKNSGEADFVIANAENSAHGRGITRETANQLLSAGVDVLTSGNHTWDNKDIFNFINQEPLLLRPENFSEDRQLPGRGFGVFDVPGRPGVRVAVANLIGRVLMGNSAASPFLAADGFLEGLRAETPIVFVDFHAETTSEKIALGRYLDGRTTCVFGTHTHVQTADEQILARGTAYITDIGMTGGHDGVIGVKDPEVIHRFLTGLPVRHEVATEDVIFCGALVTVDVETGRAIHIERVREPVD